MKERIYRVCSYLAAIASILVLLITSIDIFAFQRSFYEREYATLDTASSLDMSQEDLMKATTTLLDYLKDDRDDISTSITVREFEREAFNERETLHMIDVKMLYQNALTFRFVCLIVAILSIAYLYWMNRSKALLMLAKGYSQMAIGFVLFIAMLGIWAIADFSSVWESFHKLFFRNDLWLLNPRTDLMINMFPEEFFFHMVSRISLMFIIIFLLGFILSIYYLNMNYRFINIKHQKEINNEENHISK